VTWYETAADKVNERRIAKHVATCWSCEAMEYPPGTPTDYYFKRDDWFYATVEVKHKNRAFEAKPYIGLDVLKLSPLVHAMWTHNAPSFYVVECSDGGIYYVRAHQVCGYPVLVGGRCDRGDKHDIEPYIAIPLKLFRPVTKGVLP
jgi:hypothetical protein